MGDIKAGVTVMQEFCRSGSNIFRSYIEYMGRDDAQRHNAISTYNIYHEYMGNPDKSTGLFTESKDVLRGENKKTLKDIFQLAQDNGSVMWQTVLSFDNRWLEQNNLYDSKAGMLDERKLKQVSRIAMGRLLEKEGLDLSVWTASIHFNTDNIHVHVATVEPNPTRKIIEYQGQQEYRGKIKMKSIEACKSAVVNEIINTKEINHKINNIIRRDIVMAKQQRQLSEDPEIRSKFLELYERLPEVNWNLRNYGNNVMSKCRPLIDEISMAYVEKYHAREYEEFKNIVNRQSELYGQAYGQTNRNYVLGKEEEFLNRLGNAVLDEVKTYEKNMKNKIKIKQTDYLPQTVKLNLYKKDGSAKKVVEERDIIKQREHEHAFELTEETPIKLTQQKEEELELVDNYFESHKECNHAMGPFKDIKETTTKNYREWHKEFLTQQENDNAKYLLGIKYMDQSAKIYDSERGLAYLEEAKEAGSLHAKYFLGCCSLDKSRECYNPKKGINYIQEMADKGNEYAQFKLGCEYLKGENVNRNVNLARIWLEKAAAQNNEVAMSMLNDIETQNVGRGKSGQGELIKAMYNLQRSMEVEHNKNRQVTRSYEIEQEMEYWSQL